MSLETDSYTRQRARFVSLFLSFLLSVSFSLTLVTLHPSLFRCRSHRSPFSVGRCHFYFPLSFITSGTLPADTLVVEKDAQEGVDAFFFLLSSPGFSFRLPPKIPLSASLPGISRKFRWGARERARGESPKGRLQIDSVSRYVGYVTSFYVVVLCAQ